MVKRRIFLLIASASLGAAAATVAACSTQDGVAPAADASADTPAPRSDAAADAADGSACAPVDTSKLMPTWHPPNPFNAGKCTDSEIASYYTSCFQSSAAVAAAFRKDHPACISCIESAESDPSRGVLVWYSDFSYYYLNVGGCIANEQGDASTSSCGAALQATQTCELAACQPSCPVTSEITYNAFTACTSSVQQERCARFGAALDTSCGNIEAAGANVASCTSMGRSEKVHIVDLVTRFCGGAPDAGLDASAEGGATDGGDGGDSGDGGAEAGDASDAADGD